MSIQYASESQRIDPLTEHNFSSWFVDIRAKLRSKKLWKYTQSPYVPDTLFEVGEAATVTKKRDKEDTEWEEKTQEAADFLTPTLSSGVKLKLTELEFNNGFLMLTRLTTLCQPTGNTEFMRLSKEYYTLDFAKLKSMSEYLTHIKVLEEKIDSTKVNLDTNNRTILCLSMSLPQQYQYLVQIWAVTPLIAAEKACNMLLEVSRQAEYQRQHQYDLSVGPPVAYAAKEKCSHCGSTTHQSHKCWNEFPELAPEWFQIKIKYDARRNKANKATIEEEDLPPRPFLNM